MSTPTRLTDALSDEEVRALFDSPLPPEERTPPVAYAGPWVERAKAVMQTFGKPPLCEDGEVRCTKCILPSGMHPALNRNDRVCFWCGNDELVLSGSAIRDWYRVPPPPEPMPEEEKAEPPAPTTLTYIGGGGQVFITGAGTNVGGYTGYAPFPHGGQHTFHVDAANPQGVLVKGSGGAQCAQCVVDLQAASMKQQLHAASYGGNIISSSPIKSWIKAMEEGDAAREASSKWKWLRPTGWWPPLPSRVSVSRAIITCGALTGTAYSTQIVAWVPGLPLFLINLSMACVFLLLTCSSYMDDVDARRDM